MLYKASLLPSGQNGGASTQTSREAAVAGVVKAVRLAMVAVDLPGTSIDSVVAVVEAVAAEALAIEAAGDTETYWIST